MRNSTIPKTLQAALDKHKDVITAYDMEEDFYDDASPWSIWIYLKEGYWCPVMECGIIHESTARQAIDRLSSVTKQIQ